MLAAIAGQAKDPWAELEEAVAAREGRPMQQGLINNGGSTHDASDSSEKANKPNQPGKVTVLPAIIAGRPLTVSIYPPSSFSDEERYEIAEKLVQVAYNDWFSNAVDWIEYEHREKEFADVLPLLRQGVKIEFVDFLDAKDNDIWISFDDTLERMREACQCDSCLGCEASGAEGFSMVVHLFAGGAYSTVVHELGHTLGLADAYEGGYEQNASKTHRSEQRIFVSVMDAGDNELSGDDADGLINMIDSWKIYAMKKQHPIDWQKYISPRILKGWDSLLRYKNGTSLDRYRMGTSEKVLQQTQQKQASQAAQVAKNEAQYVREQLSKQLRK